MKMKMEATLDVEKAKRDLVVLTEKTCADVRQLVTDPVAQAGRIAGITGIFGLVQKVSSCMMMGSGIIFAALRDNVDGTFTDDDLLWCCLMAYEGEKSDATGINFVERVQGHFKAITGRRHKVPDWFLNNYEASPDVH